MVYYAWSVLLGRPDWGKDWALILLVEGMTVGAGLAVLLTSIHLEDVSDLVLTPDRIAVRSRRKVESLHVTEVIGIFSYYLLGDEVFVVRGRGGRKIYFGPGLSEPERREVKVWLGVLAERQDVPVLPNATEKELKVLFKADDAFWLDLQKGLAEPQSRS